MEKRNIKNLRIIRLLLGSKDTPLTKYRIAKLAECSYPWALEFLRSLESKKIIEGTKVIDIDRLVGQYIKAMPKVKYVDFFYKNPEDILKKTKLKYALTTYAAENFYTKQLFLSRYDLYIGEKDYALWKKNILANGLIGKGNIRLLLTYDDKILDEAIEQKGMSIVALPQLLVDLKREGGVCMESYNLLVHKNV
ncbi:MAG: hypothetical protein V1859_11165 [archaeon]